MSAPVFDPDAVLDAMAPLLGLTVTSEARPAVLANLRVAATMAALVVDEPGDHAEPAALFVPTLLPGPAA